MSKYIIDIHGEIEGDYDIIGKYQEPKTGHWIDEYGNFVPMTDGEPIHSCSCSNCRKWLVASDEYRVVGYYCPNCGAKMESEE